MSLPTPDGLAWVLGLLGWIGAAAVAGEGVRGVLAHRCAWFRSEEVLGRLVLDVYLAGALLYLLAVLPFTIFRPAVIAGVWFGFGIVGLVLVFRAGGRGTLVARARTFLRPLASWPYAMTLGATALLFAAEIAAAANVPTGNTFDSSVDATFGGLLAWHGQAGLRLSPVSPAYTAYPQGPAAWFMAAGWALGWSPAQAPLLLTPIFLALVPLAGFTLGRRWFGSVTAGSVVAIGLAVLVPGTRYLAYGSNDFALAFPLVLYLVGRGAEWDRSQSVGVSDAIAFGLLAGCSAALNPVGAEWVFSSLLLLGAARHGRSLRALGSWLGRWSVALGVALAAVIPSLVALGFGALGVRASGTVGPTVGISFAQLVGWSDPFLFGAAHEAWGPLVLLQVELAALLVVGALVVWGPRSGLPTLAGTPAAWLAAGIVGALAWLFVAVAAGAGVGPARWLTAVTSPGQLSLLLFTSLGLVALAPIVAVVDDRRSHGSEALRSSGGERTPRPRRSLDRPTVLAVVGLLLLPGTIATGVWLPSENHSIYADYSQVTASDFSFLEGAGAVLPPGARVLVAPGSAAEFLPAYDPDLTLLFPMTGSDWTSNATYLALRGLLDNGTLGATGPGLLNTLDVQYIAVTGNDTVLFPAFSASAFLSQRNYPEVFHVGDAYLFENLG